MTQVTVVNKDLDESNHDNKRKKYVCKVCGETGHNSRNKAKCKQQEQLMSSA